MSCKDCINFRYCYDEDKGTLCEAHEKRPKRRKLLPYERTKAAVYATGNKWAIENFNATHN